MEDFKWSFDKHKIMIVENASLHIKILLNTSNLILKFRIVASQVQIHTEENYKIEMKEYFWYF